MTLQDVGLWTNALTIEQFQPGQTVIFFLGGREGRRGLFALGRSIQPLFITSNILPHDLELGIICAAKPQRSLLLHWDPWL